jgi:hypothetical protein
LHQDGALTAAMSLYKMFFAGFQTELRAPSAIPTEDSGNRFVVLILHLGKAQMQE